MLIFVALFSQAQEMMSQASEPQMADQFRANGKIFVVIGVIGIIFLALVIFMIYIERKVKKIEEKVKSL